MLGSGAYHGGVIAADHGDGTYAVQYHDGDYEERVARAGESKRLVVESPWSQLPSECRRCRHPPRLDKEPL
jgi:hypothetical protein